MSAKTLSRPAAATPTDPARRLGFAAAVLTVGLTLFTFAVAVLTPPLSGPGCTAGAACFEYPYADIAGRFPRDYYWMFPAMLLSVVFVALASAIHDYAAPEKKVFSRIGFAFAVVSAAVLIVDYFVQVSVIPPSLANGEMDGISLLSQFNPHGVFIALEEVGFTMVSVALLFMAPVFAGGGRLETAVRWTFVGAFVLTMLALGLFSLQYGIFREYRFEIAAITINWLVMIVGGMLLSFVFRRK